MRTVYKYELPSITSQQEVSLPKGARIIHVGEQHGMLALWADVRTTHENEDRTILIIGTGDEIGE